MDTKTQNIVLKSITALIIFLGVLFTVMVMGDDNPAEMSYEQQDQWAIKEAKDLELNKEMTSSELNQHITTRTAEIAEEKNLFFSFEASVAGGVPILKLIREGLIVNDITKLTGVLNGTANYILSEMEKEQKSFDIVIKEAQKKGVAEADPSLMSMELMQLIKL